jgi:hypothetical protein
MTISKATTARNRPPGPEWRPSEEELAAIHEAVVEAVARAVEPVLRQVSATIKDLERREAQREQEPAR